MNASRKYDILDNHNDYDLIIPRNDAEDIRNDPFGLGSTVKGLANVNHKKNLSNYAEELVSQYAKYSRDQYELSLEMVPEEEQNEFIRLYIESIDREIEWACYGTDDSINSDFLCALLSMLKNDCKDTRENFASVTRKNVLVYYKNSLEEILNIACEDFLHNSMNEQGYGAQRDMEHGDIIWSKF